MAAPKSYPWSFVDVDVFSEDRVYFVASHDESTRDNIPVSALMRWSGDWGIVPVPIFAVSLCTLSHPERTVLALGNEGTVIRWGTQGSTQEHIDTAPDGPSRGGMREIRTIGQRAYAVGMGRMVYRCDGEQRWTRIDAGVRADLRVDDEAGFNSMDGFNEDECYAVGWNGEIWSYVRQQWQQHDSPTNLALQRVVCGGDGCVYALGQRGLILKGREGRWGVIEQDLTREDFWGACWFKGRLYAATANGLFVLDGDDLKAVDTGKLGKSRADCFYRLSANAECIWSVGERMAIYSSDGQRWKEVAYS